MESSIFLMKPHKEPQNLRLIKAEPLWLKSKVRTEPHLLGLTLLISDTQNPTEI